MATLVVHGTGAERLSDVLRRSKGQSHYIGRRKRRSRTVGDVVRPALAFHGERATLVVHGTGAARLSDVESKDSQTVSEDGNNGLEQSVM